MNDSFKIFQIFTDESIKGEKMLVCKQHKKKLGFMKLMGIRLLGACFLGFKLKNNSKIFFSVLCASAILGSIFILNRLEVTNKIKLTFSDGDKKWMRRQLLRSMNTVCKR